MRKLIVWILVIASTLALFENDAEARRRKRRAKSKRAPIINEKKLYERMGGSSAVAQMVDEWLRLNLADAKVAPYFSQLTGQPEKLGRVRRAFNDQLCELADGPCTVQSADLKSVHESLVSQEEPYLIFARHLFLSMQKLQIPEREKNEMLARLGELRAEILDEQSAVRAKEANQGKAKLAPSVSPNPSPVASPVGPTMTQ